MKSNRHQVVNTRNITESTYVLRITRDGLNFTPGQTVTLGTPKLGINREYSIYSGNRDNFLEFLIREVPGGALSPTLRSLLPGEEIEVNGPFGTFQIDENRLNQFHLLIATGTGIAPFHSFVRSFVFDYSILHGIRFERETYDFCDYESNRYFPCVSQEKVGRFNGRVTEYLAEINMRSKTSLFLCGNRNIISNIYDVIKEKKMRLGSIRTEVFF